MGNFGKKGRYDVYKGGSYSQAVKWVSENEDIIFVAGQAAMNDKGEVVGVGDIKVQTAQAIENIKAVLDEAGAKLEDVVQLTYYVTDMKNLPQIKEVREQYWKDRYPTSTLVEINKLFKEDFLIEIEAVAIVGHF